MPDVDPKACPVREDDVGDRPAVAHPAKFSRSILDELERLVRAEAERLGYRPRLIDPFCGIGKIHELGAYADTVGIEIEPLFAAAHERTQVGDATSLPFEDDSFDIAATSPVYPNGVCDSHDAKDDSKRNTYRAAVGGELQPWNAALAVRGRTLTREYCRMHYQAWAELLRVLKPGALAIINTSNHFRTPKKGEALEEVRTNEFHIGWFLSRGCYLVEVRRVPTPRNGFGANGDVRVDGELVSVFRTPTKGGGLL